MKKIVIGAILVVIVIGIFALAVSNPNLRENKETWFGTIDVKPEKDIPIQEQKQSISPKETVSSASQINCDPSYPDVCIPPYPPDLDCGEIPHKNFRVMGDDRHGFDRDNDGIGCES